LQYSNLPSNAPATTALRPSAMPSARNSKRTTDSQVKSAKRAKVATTPADKKFNIVMGALANEETVVPGPESCRAMLIAVATAALKIPKDERHADQDAVHTMLVEIFDAEKSRWESRVADANSILEKATAERIEKMSAKDAVDAELKAQKDVVSEGMEAQSKAMEVVEECKEELSTAQALRRDAEAEKEISVKTREYGLAIQATIESLKQGLFENPKELKGHITDVCMLFESLGTEEGLVKTLPQILRRKPEERGSFDELALQQLDVYLNNHLSAVSDKIEAADAIVADHAVAATAWEAAVEVAEDKKRERDEALHAASAQQDQLQESLISARKLLKEYTAAVKTRGADLATEQFGLQSVEDVHEALEFLKEYVAPALAPEETVKEPAEVMDESADASAEMPVEMSADEIEQKQDVSLDNLIPAAKSKQIDVHMNVEDVPSPSKKARHSIGADSHLVAA